MALCYQCIGQISIRLVWMFDFVLRIWQCISQCDVKEQTLSFIFTSNGTWFDIVIITPVILVPGHYGDTQQICLFPIDQTFYLLVISLTYRQHLRYLVCICPFVTLVVWRPGHFYLICLKHRKCDRIYSIIFHLTLMLLEYHLLIIVFGDECCYCGSLYFFHWLEDWLSSENLPW